MNHDPDKGFYSRPGETLKEFNNLTKCSGGDVTDSLARKIANTSEKTYKTKLVGINAAGRRVGFDHQTRPPLSDSEVELIRQLYEKDGWKKSTRPPSSFPGWTYEKLASKFGVSKYNIRDIVKYKWRVDYPVKFKKVRVKD